MVSLQKTLKFLVNKINQVTVLPTQEIFTAFRILMKQFTFELVQQKEYQYQHTRRPLTIICGI